MVRTSENDLQEPDEEGRARSKERELPVTFKWRLCRSGEDVTRRFSFRPFPFLHDLLFFFFFFFSFPLFALGCFVMIFLGSRAKKRKGKKFQKINFVGVWGLDWAVCVGRGGGQLGIPYCR